jgi:hypothetical protein
MPKSGGALFFAPPLCSRLDAQQSIASSGVPAHVRKGYDQRDIDFD